jgi:hypothetical protein
MGPLMRDEEKVSLAVSPDMHPRRTLIDPSLLLLAWYQRCAPVPLARPTLVLTYLTPLHSSGINWYLMGVIFVLACYPRDVAVLSILSQPRSS